MPGETSSPAAGSDPVRYLCLLCHTALPVARTCPSCGGPALDLTHADVRTELEAQVEERLRRHGSRERTLFIVVASVITAIIIVVWWQSLWEDDTSVPWRHFSLRLGWLIMIAIWYGLKRLAALVYTRLRPGTATAVFAARRGRGRAVDPARLDARTQLDWLAGRTALRDVPRDAAPRG